jgi:hypothetical protein
MSEGTVVEFLTLAERDQQMLQLRLAGVSITTIASRYKVKPKTVMTALDSLLPSLNNETRARYLKESIAACDLLTSWWWAQSRTSLGAAALILKIQERRAALLGLDTPAQVRVDLAVAGAGPQQSSTAELLEALDRIAGEKPASGTLELVASEPDPPA